MFLLKNYNKFLTGTKTNFRWEDFFIHRFKSDLKKLLTFPTYNDAKKFLDKNLQVEVEFDAWILNVNEIEWN